MENIEIYYESIKQVNKQILDWEREKRNRPKPLKRKITDFLIGGSIVLFLISLIPILPSLIVFAGSRFSWNIGSFNLNQATILTYGLAWLLSIVISFPLIFLAIMLNDKARPISQRHQEKAPQTLSPEQLTFIYIYEAYKELKIYFVSHIDQHIEKTLDSLIKVQPSKHKFVDFDFARGPGRKEIESQEMEMYYLRELRKSSLSNNYSAFWDQISIAGEFLQTFEKYSWFHIDDLTKSRLQALIAFQSKVLNRLENREDLPAVLIVLQNLSRFLYAYLPEHQTNRSPEELTTLQTKGNECLDIFVQDLNKLMELPDDKPDKKSVHHLPKPTVFQRLHLFYLSNIFFRFTFWLILLLIVTTSLVYIVSLKFTELDINNMVSMVIATSVGGAVALVVLGDKNIDKVRAEPFQKTRDKEDLNE